jgi:hypothetical protein
VGVARRRSIQLVQHSMPSHIRSSVRLKARLGGGLEGPKDSERPGLVTGLVRRCRRQLVGELEWDGSLATSPVEIWVDGDQPASGAVL